MDRALGWMSLFFVLAGCAGEPPCPDGWVEAPDGSCDATAETVAAIEGRIGPIGAYGFVRLTSTGCIPGSASPNCTMVSYPENREIQIYETHSGGACQASASLVAMPLTDETGTWAAALDPGLHCAVLVEPTTSMTERIDFSVSDGLVETQGFDLTEESF